MDHVIHVYLGTVCAGAELTDKYPLGEKHAFLFYLKADTGSNYDENKAKEIITNRGYVNIVFSRVGTVDPKQVTGEKKIYCEDAIEHGSTLVIYSEPVTEEDPFKKVRGS